LSVKFSRSLLWGNLTKTGMGKSKFYFNVSNSSSKRLKEISKNDIIEYKIYSKYESIPVKISNIKSYTYIASEAENTTVISFENSTHDISLNEIIIDSRNVYSVKYARHDSESIWFVIKSKKNVNYSVSEEDGYYSIKVSTHNTDTGDDYGDDTPTGNDYDGIIAKNIFYSNIYDRVYFKFIEASLTEGGEDLNKLYTGKYEDNNKKYIIEFPSHLADLEPGLTEINDKYIKNLEVLNCGNGKTQLIFTSKDSFIYCVFTRYNQNAEIRSTAITLLKPATSSQKLVVIDPGHGGGDPGAVYGGTTEKELNLSITLKLKKELEKNNINAYIIREDDSYVGLYERAYIANYLNASMFICLHNNAASRPAIEGTETYYFYKYNDDCNLNGKELAEIIQKNIVNETGSFDRGIKSNMNYVVLKGTAMPAVLTEIGYMTNEEELEKLKTDEYQDKIVNGLIKGIIEAVGYL
jgi:N-acetylmuramoyl-L-alanine amidase